MKFKLKYRPYPKQDLTELVGIFDLSLNVPKAKDEVEQENQDLQAALNYLKSVWMNVDIVSIEKLH